MLANLLAIVLAGAYARRLARRGWGDDAIYWVARRKRYVGAASLGYGPGGSRVRRTVSGKTKQEVKDKLKALHEELARSVRAPKNYTLRLAVQDWLSDGMDGRSAQTVAKYRNVLKPILHDLGDKVLAELPAADVRAALARLARTHSTETVSIARLGLERAIRHAETNDLIARNVAALVDAPKGRAGRPSNALTLEQAAALLQASRHQRTTQEFPGHRPRPPSLMRAYIVLCLLVGVRTEEARALRDHRQSRRHDRAAAGDLWQERGLVFATQIGTPPDAGNVRRMFKDVCRAAGIGVDWTPRELRTSSVSLMSQRGISSEEFARLVGHSSTRVTETVYRRELRPVITTGAEVMDELFGREPDPGH